MIYIFLYYYVSLSCRIVVLEGEKKRAYWLFEEFRNTKFERFDLPCPSLCVCVCVCK